jgi:hypothetical protein
MFEERGSCSLGQLDEEATPIRRVGNPDENPKMGKRAYPAQCRHGQNGCSNAQSQDRQCQR